MIEISPSIKDTSSTAAECGDDVLYFEAQEQEEDKSVALIKATSTHCPIVILAKLTFMVMVIVMVMVNVLQSATRRSYQCMHLHFRYRAEYSNRPIYAES